MIILVIYELTANFFCRIICEEKTIMSERELYDSGLTFQEFFGMSSNEKAEYEKGNPFPYNTVEEYIDDVVEWLCQSSWKYSREQALRCIKDHRAQVYRDYELHTPIDLCGAEAGYYCG